MELALQFVAGGGVRSSRLGFLFGLAVCGSLWLASTAGATPIGPSCGTCQGSIYELSYSGAPIATTATTETFRIKYTIDTTGYSGPGQFLDAVALKVASSFVDATLVTAPGGVGNWIEMTGGLANAGCTGSGSGFDCVMVALIANALTVPAGVYTWEFDIEVLTGELFVDDEEASVKARYITITSQGVVKKAGDLVSEGITLTNVPEPQLGLLLLAAAPLVLRRRAR